MNTIWVTGSKGQLGTELHLQHKKLDNVLFHFTDIHELDLTNKQAVLDFTKKEKPQIIINCAGYTAVDKAEEEKELAFLLNKDIPVYLNEAATTVGATLIHISTDYVYNGNSEIPYQEDDPTDPQSVYGKSKLDGELEVLKNPKNLVIRTSWMYSAHGNNFVKTMLRLGKERKELNVVADQVGCPTSAADLADALLKISKQILEGKNNTGGIYQYSNEGQCSWYEFAKAIMEITGIKCTINPISTEQYPTPAKRPAYSVMSKEKISKVFGLYVPEWKVSLLKYFQTLISKMIFP
ncbi:MAG: dTDP-4-dehydrorhamnose reductase [Bacteroidales bacterium]|nr:dTDP-4-dehydrorhamnose reductase [Bacteroidales bacterium]